LAAGLQRRNLIFRDLISPPIALLETKNEVPPTDVSAHTKTTNKKERVPVGTLSSAKIEFE